MAKRLKQNREVQLREQVSFTVTSIKDENGRIIQEYEGPGVMRGDHRLCGYDPTFCNEEAEQIAQTHYSQLEMMPRGSKLSTTSST